MASRPARRLGFGVIGIDHGHVRGMADGLVAAGAQLAGVSADDTAAARAFARRYGSRIPVMTAERLLAATGVGLIVSAAPPYQRAAIGVRALQAGKHFLAAKPAFVDMADLETARRTVAATGRRFLVWYSERLASPATLHAVRIASQGSIGRVVQLIGIAPHCVGAEPRAEWFFDARRGGGILADLATHFMDQFLAFTAARAAVVVSSAVANYAHREHPAFDDFGEANVVCDDATGYVRADWLSPAGLGTWGDNRLIVLGTEGYIEVRKTIDLAGRAGTEHLFAVDRAGVRYVNCANETCPFFELLLRDIETGSTLAMDQHQCFLASELAILAQLRARRAPLFS